VRDEACAGVFIFWRGFADCSQHKLVVWCEETVAGVRGVVLGLCIAPAMSSSFLLEDGGNGSLRVEGRLPVWS